MLVAEATAGADSNLIVAALLHDTIEDQGRDIGLLRGAFPTLINMPTCRGISRPQNCD
jgi:hypothetical protein